MVMLSDAEARDAPPKRPAPVQAATTRDIDEQAARLKGWNQTYDQMSAGPFSGYFFEAQFEQLLLFREITSNVLHQTGALPAYTIAVGVPIALQGNATFCGKACDGTQLHVFSGNDAFEFYSPRGLDMAGFVLTGTDLSRALSGDDLEALACALARPHLHDVDRAAADALRQIFRDAYEVMTSCPDLSEDPLRFSLMSRDVTAALALALTRNDHVNGRCEVSAGKRALIVRDARDLVTECPEQYARVDELCRALGISRRALQQSFQDTLGLKPSAYLRAVRMNGARRAIKNARSVSDAATLWGFWHFGRFARDYRAMFGELPSEAFRRLHGSPDVVPMEPEQSV